MAMLQLVPGLSLAARGVGTPGDQEGAASEGPVARACASLLGAATSLQEFEASVQQCLSAAQAGTGSPPLKTLANRAKDFLQATLLETMNFASSVSSVLDIFALELDQFIEHTGAVQHEVERCHKAASAMALRLEGYASSAAACELQPFALIAMDVMSSMSVILGFSTVGLAAFSGAVSALAAVPDFIWPALSWGMLGILAFKGAKGLGKKQQEAGLNQQAVDSCQRYLHQLAALTRFFSWVEEELQAATPSAHKGAGLKALGMGSTVSLQDWDRLKSLWREVRAGSCELCRCCLAFQVVADKALLRLQEASRP